MTNKLILALLLLTQNAHAGWGHFATGAIIGHMMSSNKTIVTSTTQFPTPKCIYTYPTSAKNKSQCMEESAKILSNANSWQAIAVHEGRSTTSTMPYCDPSGMATDLKAYCEMRFPK